MSLIAIKVKFQSMWLNTFIVNYINVLSIVMYAGRLRPCEKKKYFVPSTYYLVHSIYYFVPTTYHIVPSIYYY